MKEGEIQEETWPEPESGGLMAEAFAAERWLKGELSALGLTEAEAEENSRGLKNAILQLTLTDRHKGQTPMEMAERRLLKIKEKREREDNRN